MEYNLNEILEILKNIGLIFFGFVTGIFYLIFLWKIIISEKKIKFINIEINEMTRKNKEKIVKVGDQKIDIAIDFSYSKEDIVNLKFAKKIKELKKEKENIVEEISLYKIFKK